MRQRRGAVSSDACLSRAKHDAWAKLGNMSKAKAIEQYLKLIDEIAPRWRAWKKAKL